MTSEILGEATTPAPSNAADGLARPTSAAWSPSVRRSSGRSTATAASAQWLDALGRHKNSVNVGSYLGATTVRAYAMGQAPGTPNAAQLDTMRVRRQAVDARWRVRDLVAR